MSNKMEVLVAKELKMNFFIVLIGILLVLGYYFGLYLIHKPPMNRPLTEEEKLNLRMNGDKMMVLGNFFSNVSEYDCYITVSEMAEDRINEVRQVQFKADIEDRTKASIPYIFITLTGGRYLFKLIKWVKNTSKKG